MSIPNPKFSVGDGVMVFGLVSGYLYDSVVTRCTYRQADEKIIHPKDSYYATSGGYYYMVENCDHEWNEGNLRPKPKQDDSEAFERFMKKIDLTTKHQQPEEVTA